MNQFELKFSSATYLHSFAPLLVPLRALYLIILSNYHKTKGSGAGVKKSNGL